MSKTVSMLILVAAIVLVITLGGVAVSSDEPTSTAPERSSPVGTAFTYQGYLTEGDTPADGLYAFSFSLYDDPQAGSQVGTTQYLDDIAVRQGLFATELDFGPIFGDTALWLQVGVRPAAGTGPYDSLAPRQHLTPTPLALYALYASRAPWAGLSGLPGDFADQVDNDTLAGLSCGDGQVAKWDGSLWICGDDDAGAGSEGDITAVYAGDGLQGGGEALSVTLHISAGAGISVSADSLSVAPSFQLPQTCAGDQTAKWDGSRWVCNDSVGGTGWSLTGNYGTTPGTHFLGTTDLAALELHVNSNRAWRLEPGASSPNVLGGYHANAVGPTVSGATIGGGGRDLAINQASGDYSTVDGGAGNMADGYASAVGGGESNSAGGSYDTAGGGSDNSVSGPYAFVGGGQTNAVTGTHATVAGGGFNQATAPYATVAGGSKNEATETHGSVGGGRYNSVAGAYGTIAGGGPSDPDNPTTSNNRVYDDYGTVAGGGDNIAGLDDGNQANQSYATIGGGAGNRSLDQYTTVPGGMGNTASGYAATVGGGADNTTSNPYAIAAGGEGNTANGQAATVSGGSSNTASADYAVLGGGSGNQAGYPFATIGGGANNVVTATHGTIAGGNLNWVGGSSAAVGGGEHNVSTGGHATVGGGYYNVVTATFGTIAGGGPSDPDNPTTSNNQVFDDYGTVSGGGGNVAGDDDGDPTQETYATVGGGMDNTAANEFATVGGGSANTAAGYAATAGGGGGNSASNNYATVGGGSFNAANANYATIGGGAENIVEGTHGTIPGGRQNHAGGAYSLAAGYAAHAEHTASFVWSGGFQPFTTTAPFQYLIDAPGGVGIGTNSPPQMLTVQGSGLFLSGAEAVARGSYTSPQRVLDAPSAVHATGHEIYVTSSSTHTLAIFDASDPDQITYLGHSTSNLSGPSDVFVAGQRAYVTSASNDRLVVFDVSDPAHPDSLGSTAQSLSNPVALYVAGKYAYVVSSGVSNGLAIFDISDPQHIRLKDVATTYLSGATGVFVAGNYAYVTSSANNRLVIFDVADPRPGQTTAMGYFEGPFIGPRAVYVSGRYAYVVAEGSSELVIVDISDPSNISLAGSTSTNLDTPRDVFVSGDLAYVASSGNDRLAVFDVSDPANIVAQGFTATGANSTPVSLSASGKHLYVVTETDDKLAVYDVNHLEAPTLQTGNLQAAALDISGNAAINNDLAIDGGLHVGSGGALIQGSLSVAGQDDSHILGALSVGGAGAFISDTVLLTQTVWVTAPTHALDVIGEGRFRVNDYNHLALRSPNAGSDEDAYIDLIRSDQTTIMTPTARIEFDVADPFTHSTSIRFHTQAAADPTMVSRLEISAEGHVLPGADGVYQLGQAVRRWDTVYSENGVQTTSDGRYKESVSALPYGLAEVSALRPVTFRWTQDPDSGLHYGLIAQEVGEVLPEIVRGTGGKDGVLSMNYSELVPVLVQAVQEQQAEIDRQAGQIAELEARLTTLENASGPPASLPGWLATPNPLWLGSLVLGMLVLVGRRRMAGRP